MSKKDDLPLSDDETEKIWDEVKKKKDEDFVDIPSDELDGATDAITDPQWDRFK